MTIGVHAHENSHVTIRIPTPVLEAYTRIAEGSKYSRNLLIAYGLANQLEMVDQFPKLQVMEEDELD